MERGGGIVANPWHGSRLDALDPGLQGAATRTWQGTPPLGALVTPPSQTGVPLTKEAMEAGEATSKRFPHLAKWFGDIVPTPVPLWDS